MKPTHDHGIWHWSVLVGYPPLRRFQRGAKLTHALRPAAA